MRSEACFRNPAGSVRRRSCRKGPGLLLGIPWEDRVLQVWPNRAQHGGAEHHAGDELAHDRRLAKPLHGLSKQSSDDQEKSDLREEDRLRGTRWRAFRRESVRCREQREDRDTDPGLGSRGSPQQGIKSRVYSAEMSADPMG
jgi:hypothetical protein